MTRAHPQLLAYRSVLDELAPELRGLLELWLPRLAALIGPHRHHATPERGDPDGYDGFTRRGSPDRLALSEWALRELHPDEFLRRAIAGEQLYLRPAHRVPRAARRALVLFDAGPEQLGAARLAHLALLIVLAERARATGGVLSWATLQRPGNLRVVQLPADLALLAAERTWRHGPFDPSEWVERIGQIDDCFAVGGPELAGLASALGGRHLAVQERADELEVRLARGRAVRLPLADRVALAGVLQAPLQVQAPRSAPRHTSWFEAIPRTLLFSPSGNHLIVELASGGVAAIKTAPVRGKRGFRPKLCYFPDSERAIAATVYHRKLVTVLAGEAGVRVLGLPEADRAQAVPCFGEAPTPPDGGLGLALAARFQGKLRVHYSDGAGALHQVHDDRDGPIFEGDRVLTCGPGPDGARLLLSRPGGTTQLITFQAAADELQKSLAFAFEADRAQIGPMVGRFGLVPGGGLAARGADGWWIRSWGLYTNDRGEPQRIGHEGLEEEVIGVCGLPWLQIPLALVVLVERRRLVARYPGGQVHLLTAPVPVLNAAVAPGVPRLAMALGNGKIAVRDLESGDLLLSVRPGGSE